MKKGRRYILITVIGILAIILLIAACCLMPFFKRVLTLKGQAEQIIRAGSREDFTRSKSSVVYDCNNEVLMTYSGEKDLYYVKSEDIPQILKDAFIVMEDREFYSHKGVDFKAIVRAAIANYQADGIVQGASTITQQVARNIYLNQDVNWDRKILEAFMAMEMEKKYSKEDILEFYLNNIYFG
ncbi:MAG: transglycosylase domain-containing protein, partial [Alistipes sp.]|nr:transglycosylase domain-containing protein [Alistipes sp.]